MIIILLGLPGCGKTTIGRYLAAELGYKWVDVDDHVLEPVWKCSVSAKLKELGSLNFIKEEGKALLGAVKSFENDTVVSLTGSNPLSAEAMISLKVKISKYAKLRYTVLPHPKISIDLDVWDIIHILGD